MKQEVDPNTTGCFDFPEFISLMARHMKEVDAENELFNALCSWDNDENNPGFCMLATLKY